MNEKFKINIYRLSTTNFALFVDMPKRNIVLAIHSIVSDEFKVPSDLMMKMLAELHPSIKDRYTKTNLTKIQKKLKVSQTSIIIRLESNHFLTKYLCFFFRRIWISLKYISVRPATKFLGI